MSLNLANNSILQKNTEFDDRFKKLTALISRFLANEGVFLDAYTEGLPHFSKLSMNEKRAVTDHLQFYHDLCSEQITEGYTLKDNPTFAWRAISKLGLTPRSDLFSYLKNEHIVQIYSANNVQLFSNFRFFEICSYTLEELFSLEWWVLYERDPKITSQLFEYSTKIFSGEIAENFKPQVEKHFVREKSSVDKFILDCTCDLAGPLYKNKRPEAFIAFSTAHIVQHFC